MKTALALGAALVALLPGSLAAPASAAAPTVPIRPTQLDRGEDSSVARMVGDTTIVDGDLRIELKRAGYLLGESGDTYVVASYPRVLRVSADGTTERLTRYSMNGSPELSSDGEVVLISRYGKDRSVVRVVDAETGDEVTTGRFGGYAGLLDAWDGRAVMTSHSPARTFWWNYETGSTKRIVKRAGGTADIAADRLATLTGDPYQGGCTVVSRLTRPRTVLWRSCEEIPFAFAPNGRRMVTVSLLADGLGPGEVTARTTRGGKAIATYTAYWFATTTWEDDTTLLFDAHTKKRAAIVRCVVDACERASGVRRSSLRP